MLCRPCFLIPHYRHEQALAATVAGLKQFNLPIIIVDDGSGDASVVVVKQLQLGDAEPEVHYLPKNLGKGGATMHGFRLAAAQGFTHAFQIDADGQHDQSVIPDFLAAMQAQPDALIAGTPVYDASIPKARLYGRKITDFWVAIETLSWRIDDAMCGFRLYPLAPVLALMDRSRIGPRMDFDIEILVRLHWQQTPMQFLPCRVTYPLDGVSHFKGLRDNWLISKLHTRLFFGMLLRLPLLLWRKAQAPRHWSQHSESGSAGGVGIRILLSIYRVFGRAVFRVALYPVMLYFFLRQRGARESSRTFLLAAQKCGSRALKHTPTWRDSFRHFYAFGEALLDKLLAWSGQIKSSDIDFPQREQLQQQLRDGRGVVLVGAHLGNLELIRAIAQQQSMRVLAVYFTEHAQQFQAQLQQQHPDVAKDVIAVSDIGADTAMRLRAAIDAGHILVIVGDRTSVKHSERSVLANFLGRPAPFAIGPWVLASLLECPVNLFFCVREGQRHRVILETFSTPILRLERARRQQHLQEIIQFYAQRLQEYALRYPLQWFNFYDFWAVTPSQASEHHHE